MSDFVSTIKSHLNYPNYEAFELIPIHKSFGPSEGVPVSFMFSYHAYSRASIFFLSLSCLKSPSQCCCPGRHLKESHHDPIDGALMSSPVSSPRAQAPQTPQTAWGVWNSTWRRRQWISQLQAKLCYLCPGRCAHSIKVAHGKDDWACEYDLQGLQP